METQKDLCLQCQAECKGHYCYKCQAEAANNIVNWLKAEIAELKENHRIIKKHYEEALIVISDLKKDLKHTENANGFLKTELTKAKDTIARRNKQIADLRGQK